MDRYEKRYQHELRSPSFSSTLLDEIYRSIDKGDVKEEVEEERELVLNRKNMRKKQSNSSSSSSSREKSNFEDGFQKLQRNNDGATFFYSTSSSSSESSETEPGLMRPKPVRTGSVSSTRVDRNLLPSLQRKTQLPEIHIPKGRDVISLQKPKQEKSFNKSKSTSSAKNGDLKKPKQPISPGGRLASFLNSIFMAAGNAKKAKVSKSDRSSSSTCSSASSYSRSCLSKTPSSRGNSLKSVRFCPVSVIVDEDCRPCGQKRVYERELDLGHGKKVGEYPPLMFGEELKLHLMEKNRQVEEAAKELLHGYRRKSEILREVMRDVHENDDEDEEEEDDDDAMSCSSSDLFELENLAEIGTDRYREELPVYETTRLDTNRAIANGLIR